MIPSFLSTKKLIALRKAPEYKETLVYGTFAPYQEEQKNLIAYTRNGEKNLLILGNMQHSHRRYLCREK